jgi:tetrahydromethanopterin S-methyltransferase subunit E
MGPQSANLAKKGEEFMENKWRPCFCGMALGILVIVFAWWKVSFAPIALTVVGGLVILHGLINKCCCRSKKKEGECCQ